MSATDISGVGPGTGTSDSGPALVPVSVYSDYTCPWCYIGSRRLDRLKEKLSGRVTLDVEWKPFEIHPEVPREGMPVEELGYPEEQWKAMQARLREQAADEGLEIGNRPKVSNTHEALAAAAYAQDVEPDRFQAFHDALFRAYFGDGRDLGDREVLREIAGASGLDVSALSRALEEGRYDPVLQETTAEARRLGITGTPTYVFGERYGAVGAQPVAYLERTVERVLEERDGGE